MNRQFQRNAARDAAFYGRCHKQNEVNSFINSGNSGRDTIVKQVLWKDKSGLSDIRLMVELKHQNRCSSKVTPTPAKTSKTH